MSSSTPEPSPHAYEAFTQRLFSQNQFSIKLGLDRMQRALHAAGSPQLGFPSILVAGTNGKGTTASLLTSLLAASGLKTGLFTSPHLVDLRERFRIDGQPASRGDVIEVGQAIMACFGGVESEAGLQRARQWGWRVAARPWQGDQVLTFFELTTLMGLVIFARRGIEVAVLEIGLGGRLDAVNAIEPELSVITSIDYDHQKYLGDTLTLIAGEKAAIMRPSKPALTCAQHPEAMSALRTYAKDMGVELTLVSDELPPITPDWLSGPFARNAALAVAAFESCRRHGLVNDSKAVEAIEILKEARWPGRRDTWHISTGPFSGRWLFDVAHNPAGMDSLSAFLEARGSMPQVGVVGLMRDKDVAGVCARLAKLPITWVTTRADTPRALEAEVLSEKLRTAGALAVEHASGLEAALRRARGMSEGEVLVCGSVYLLGDVLRVMGVGEGFFDLGISTPPRCLDPRIIDVPS